ncbi:MAG: peptidoglycan-binding protein [Coleofasciculaceae cyanobacterium]
MTLKLKVLENTIFKQQPIDSSYITNPDDKQTITKGQEFELYSSETLTDNHSHLRITFVKDTFKNKKTWYVFTHHVQIEDLNVTLQSELNTASTSVPTMLRDVRSCSTHVVRGLDQQVIDEINRIVPNVLVSFDDLNVRLGPAVWPMLQPQAKTALERAIRARGVPMTINSAYRTIAQQLILFNHYKAGRCGIQAAARPPRSNHQSGLAIDIQDTMGWKPYLERYGWKWLGPWDFPHFDYIGRGTRDIRRTAVLAFQRVWNKNSLSDRVAEDGIYGPSTEVRLNNSFIDGFGKYWRGFRVLRLSVPFMQGTDVRQVQKALADAGFNTAIDGVFGPGMERAIKSFQRTKNLVADGVVGPTTLIALGLLGPEPETEEPTKEEEKTEDQKTAPPPQAGTSAGRIIISAGNDLTNPGIKALGTTEAKEMILTRDAIVKELNGRGVSFIVVPDDLDQKRTIEWINNRALPDDVAIEIDGNAFNGSVRGTEAYYVDDNKERKEDAQKLLDALLKQVPEMQFPGRPRSRGAKPDSLTGSGKLAFCRELPVPSVKMTLCFLDNQEDLKLLQEKRDKFAQGLADGLIAWSGQTSQRNGEITNFQNINIKVKDHDYEEKGVLVNGNSFIPSDLVERLEIDLASASDIRQISYGNVLYVKAADLKPFNISVGWENETRTVLIDTVSRSDLEGADQIIGFGNATESELADFLTSNNEEGLKNFPDLPKLYIEEAEIEGVNYDVAFCQMCLATNFLRFGGRTKPEQNNFSDIGTVNGGSEGASFPDARTGVRAHIQHLKAYGDTTPLEQEVVDPRFHLVPRGAAPSAYDLGRRWDVDPDYGKKIMAIVRQLNGVV